MNSSPLSPQSVHPGFLKTKKEIEAWLRSHAIPEYTINDNLVVDAPIVDLSEKELDFILVQFGQTTQFNVHKNKLTSLKGSPQYATSFDCGNNLLTSLEFAPLKVTSFFACHSNQITSLKHSPLMESGRFNCCFNNLTNLMGFKLSGKDYGGSFYCSYNSLTSLEGAPSYILGDFQCVNNRLKDLQYSPLNVGGGFNCEKNLLESLKGAPQSINGYFSIKDNPTLLSIDCLPNHVGRSFMFGNCGPVLEKYQNIETDRNYASFLEKVNLEESIANINRDNLVNKIIKI